MNHSTETTSNKLTANIKAAGCAAKISSSELSQLVRGLPTISCPQLLTGIENFEDAAVYKISDDLALVHTVDFFPAVVDDPFLFGRIAAANALSDIYAMGAAPIMALNILCFPVCDYPLSTAAQILQGAAECIAEAGAVLAGGHSIQAAEPVFGLSVMGTVHPARILTNSGARAGDCIVITKPIGTGVALLGLKGNVLSEPARKELLASLTTLNKRSLEIASTYSLHGATDVTGFGLVGHLHEMASASGLSVELWTSRIPFLTEALELAAQGFIPAGAYANRKSYEQFADFKQERDAAVCDLIFDPQTSGGLLFAVENQRASDLVKDLRESSIQAAAIGKFNPGKPGWLEIKSDETEN